MSSAGLQRGSGLSDLQFQAAIMQLRYLYRRVHVYSKLLPEGVVRQRPFPQPPQRLKPRKFMHFAGEGL
jgi:hypothetical protein